MDYWQVMKERHSVRAYAEQPITGEVKEKLMSFTKSCCQESGLRLQMIFDEPTAFDCRLARYGKFSGVRNYLVLAGKKERNLEERCGYYGEKIVLYAQSLGLNTCWAGLTYQKGRVPVSLTASEKLCLVIAVGYGCTAGVPHRSKERSRVMKCAISPPTWFLRGVDAALLAPTALNQQKFLFSLEGDRVSVRAGHGFFTKVDLGIAKYHFELGAGNDNFRWADSCCAE